jgi:hypothetical protein
MRGHKGDRKEGLSRSERGSDPSWRDRAADDVEYRSGHKKRRWRKRETPEPSFIWQTGAIAFLTSTIGVILLALTVSDDARVTPSQLWVTAGGLILAAALCFAAHWDVNRGRRSKEYEAEELSGE